MKYRGYQSGPDTPVIELLHFNNLLIRDSKKGDLDPFLYKVQAQAPKK